MPNNTIQSLLLGLSTKRFQHFQPFRLSTRSRRSTPSTAPTPSRCSRVFGRNKRRLGQHVRPGPTNLWWGEKLYRTGRGSNMCTPVTCS